MDIDNRELYEDLVRSHARDVYRFAFRLTGSSHKAEDLVQETLYHAWRAMDSLRDHGRARAWLLQILRHRYHHWLRTKSRRVPTINDSDQLLDLPEHAHANALTRLSNQELLQRALNELKIQYKEPFLLVFMQGMTCREAAESLDLPVGTVLSRIHRARIRLRGLVHQFDPSGEHANNCDRLEGETKGTQNPVKQAEEMSHENE